MIISSSINSSVSPYLSWFALVPLFLAIGKLKPATAALCGTFWGICIYFFSVTADASYIRPTLLSFGLLAAIPALYTTGGAMLRRSIGFNPLALALGWIGVEFALRPLGLDNGLLAGTQGQSIVIQQVGRLLGYVFVAFLVAGINATLLAVLCVTRLKIPRVNSIAEPSNSQLYVIPENSMYLQMLSLYRRHSRAPPAKV